MSEAHILIDAAREHFEAGKKAAVDREHGRAQEAFLNASATAASVWRDDALDGESRHLSARLSADASWLAGTSGLDAGSTSPMRGAVLTGVEIFEREDFEEDVRLHGLYRAQCAAFELGHALMEESPIDAEALFEDAVRCADAIDTLAAADSQKKARVLANAAAASQGRAELVRHRGDPSFKEHLRSALEIGVRAVEMPDLRGPLQVEALLMLGEVSYELAMALDDGAKAIETLRSAIAWVQGASEAPGADGLMQAQALQKGAEYACVYGLYLRHEDHEEGVRALEGAVELALSVADEASLPMGLRAKAYDTAIRTRQNIALLLKEIDPMVARESFGSSDALATRAAAVEGLSPARQREFLYLAANAALEQGILTQLIAGDLSDEVAVGLLTSASEKARRAMSEDSTPHLVARAALVVCGVSGRLLQTLDGERDGARIRSELETIEAFGQRAAHCEGAADAHRTTGAAFAAEAADRLAERVKDPRERKELRHRAQALRGLQTMLESD